MRMRRPLFTLPIPSDMLNPLLKAGFKTCQDLFLNDSEPNAEVVSILMTVGYSWSQFLSLAVPFDGVTGDKLFKAERERETIATFSEALDNILGGGIPVGHVLQICGPPASGKTQLVMQLCLDVQIPVSMGGLNCSALFIDSERGFTKHRFLEMAEAVMSHCKRVGEMFDLIEEINSITVASLVYGVKYIEVTGEIEFLAAVNLIEEQILVNKIKLVVIDSITMSLIHLQNTLDRTRYLSSVVKQLQYIAATYSVAVIIINDLTSWISSNGGKTLLPAGGETMSHLSPNILLLNRHDSYFSAQIYKSSYLSHRSANFMIQKEGIRDLKSYEYDV